jgi:hypothetical protein
MHENGIQIVMYMTLITAMLVMIYKQENNIGYTTAVKRMGIELENLIMAIIIIESGGDLNKTQLRPPV